MDDDRDSEGEEEETGIREEGVDDRDIGNYCQAFAVFETRFGGTFGTIVRRNDLRANGGCILHTLLHM